MYLGQYLAIPKASNEVVEVAPANGLKTLLQVKPVTQDIEVVAWGVSTDGAAFTQPIQIELIDTDVTATVTAVSPELWRGPNLQAARGVSGTSATGYNASAEGSITATRLLDVVELRPDGGVYALWFPVPRQVAAGRFLRVRARHNTTTPLIIPWIGFDEV